LRTATAQTETSEAPDPVAAITSILETEPEFTPEDSVRDAKGKFSTKPPKPPAKPVEAAEEEVRQPEASEEDSEEEAASESSSAEDEVSEEEEATEAPAEEEADPEGINTLGDLAKVLDTDEAGLTEHLTVEGNDGEPVALAQVLKDYRNIPEATAAAERFDARSRELEGQIFERTNNLDTELAKAARLTKKLIERLRGSEPNWELLKEQNPDAYMEVRRRYIEDDRSVQDALKDLEGLERGRGQENDNQLRDVQSREIEALRRKMPEWKNTEVAKGAMNEITGYLTESGFAMEEIAELMDHRMVLVVWDAVAGSKQKKTRPTALKRIKDAKDKMKGRKPVTARARQDTDVAAKDKRVANQRHRKHQTVDSAAKVFEGLI
jgi:hypothetical protein